MERLLFQFIVQRAMICLLTSKLADFPEIIVLTCYHPFSSQFLKRKTIHTCFNINLASINLDEGRANTILNDKVTSPAPRMPVSNL